LGEELKNDGVTVHSLWPRTTIATAAIINMDGGAALAARARTPDIMADAAHVILTGDATFPTGQFLIDDEVLTAAGITDLNGYRYAHGDADLDLDIFL
jgi:citronellol/citronellal dehydrogenase